MENLHNPTHRVVRIINLISQRDDLTLTEISKILNISKSTLQPILKTLIELDFLTFNSDQRTYKIGIGIFKSAQAYFGPNDSFEIIKKSMRNIVKECNEICQMGIYDRFRPGNIFYIAKEEPIQSISLISNIGSSLPAYATALGKCILSGFSNTLVKEIYSNGLKPLTNNTVKDIETLIEDLEFVRKNGYAYEQEESAKDVECIAVPLRQNNEVIASISVSIPKYRSSTEKVKKIKNILISQRNLLELVFQERPISL